jgi:hypothetical protein
MNRMLDGKLTLSTEAQERGLAVTSDQGKAVGACN